MVENIPTFTLQEQREIARLVDDADHDESAIEYVLMKWGTDTDYTRDDAVDVVNAIKIILDRSRKL